MNRKYLAASALGLSLMFSGAAAGDADDIASEHMVAEAMLTAYFIDAALKAGMGHDEINAVLTRVADQTVISEFWITDENGRVVFTNIPDTGFEFPTDPKADTQAAPFAALLKGTENTVIQGMAKRELDGALFKYVGVSGVDAPRIVQVGVSASEISND